MVLASNHPSLSLSLSNTSVVPRNDHLIPQFLLNFPLKPSNPRDIASTNAFIAFHQKPIPVLTCPSFNNRTGTACLGSPYDQQGHLYYIQPGPETRSHFRDSSLGPHPGSAVTGWIYREADSKTLRFLCRGYQRVLAETEPVGGGERKTQQTKGLNCITAQGRSQQLPWEHWSWHRSNKIPHIEAGWASLCQQMSQSSDTHGPGVSGGARGGYRITLGEVSFFGWGQLQKAVQLRGIRQWPQTHTHTPGPQSGNWRNEYLSLEGKSGWQTTASTMLRNTGHVAYLAEPVPWPAK